MPHSPTRPDPHPAHNSGDRVQSVREHCAGTAAIAARELKDVGLAACGELAGFVHDMGKYSDAYGEYITKAARGENVRRGSVNHTFAGVRFLLENYHSGKNISPSELLSYAAGAHHGLFDLYDEDHRSGFRHRMEADIPYEQALERFYTYCLSKEDVDALFERASDEIALVFQKLRPLLSTQEERRTESYFYIGLLARLLLSAVIEGDRSDTAAFMGANVPSYIKPDWEGSLQALDEHINTLRSDTPIAKARLMISDQMAAFAEAPTGIYRLHVPTGGGKTLSSLRYALMHAQRYGKKRIFYIAPLISILEQNAKVIRDAVVGHAVVLEHHSNIINEGKAEDELALDELLQENWNAPIVVTTLVQLLNTLFDGRTSCIRRFRALANSVLIFDEVQSVPANLLTLFDLAVNFLSGVGGATVLLCSATQPAVEAVPHPVQVSPRKPVTLPKEMEDVFRRTRIEAGEPRPLAGIADQARELLRESDSLLVITNTISEAEALYDALRSDVPNSFYLSAGMCMAHRRVTLSAVEEALEMGEGKTLLVATPVIEAGVDISFACVLRLESGMDSIVQAAGRCNRNGEMEGLARVVIARPMDEKLGPLKSIRMGRNATEELLYVAKGQDLASDASIRAYYHAFYRQLLSQKGSMDFPIGAGLHDTLYERLSRNAGFCDKPGAYQMTQAFKTAGDAFCVIEDNTRSVLVPYGEGTEIIEEINGCAKWEIDRLRALLDAAKQYTINVYPHRIAQLMQSGQLMTLMDGNVLALQPTAYSNQTGLLREPEGSAFLEV